MVKTKVIGTKVRPRVRVNRSNKYIYAQLVDDSSGKTLAAVSDKGAKGKGVENAREAGEKLAELAKKKKIKTVVFDKAGYKYHGRVKALAEGLRKGGMKV